MVDSFRASVVIISKNRKDELRGAIASCLAQTVPVEVIVIDDGSTDGTPEMVAAEFPSIRFERFEQSQGYIGHRNRGARMASAPIVFSLDDDAEFSTPRVVEQTLAEFVNPRIAAVSIPFVDKNPPFGSLSPAPPGQCLVISTFVGLGHAVRRDVFLNLGGYREFLFHQTEESDFSMRLLAAGYVVCLGHADVIYHYASPRRETSRKVIFGTRNNLLRGWYYTPSTWLVPHLAGTVINSLRAVVHNRSPIWTLRGLYAGAAAIWHERRDRRPLAKTIYGLHRELIRAGSIPLSTVERTLSPLN